MSGIHIWESCSPFLKIARFFWFFFQKAAKFFVLLWIHYLKKFVLFYSYEGNFIVWQTFHRWVYSKWVYVYISTGSRATTIHESGTSCTDAKSNDLSLILPSTYLVWIQNIVNKLVFANASSYSKFVKLLQGISMTSQFHKKKFAEILLFNLS